MRVQSQGASRAGRRRWRRGGFTLIELLVVVAIIALLASILTPSLRRTAVLTRRTVCAAQLQQLGKLHGAYAADFEGRWTIGSPSQAMRDAADNTTAGVWSIWKRTLYNKNFQGGWHGNGMLYHAKYLPEGRIYYCPAWDHPFYEYDSTDPANNAWPVKNHPEDTGQTGVRQTYHYRNTLDRKAGYSGHPPRNWDPPRRVVLSDGFCRSTGNSSMWTIPGVKMHHQEGYNAMRLGGGVFWLDDRDQILADLRVPHTGWDKVEAAWQDFFD